MPLLRLPASGWRKKGDFAWRRDGSFVLPQKFHREETVAQTKTQKQNFLRPLLPCAVREIDPYKWKSRKRPVNADWDAIPFQAFILPWPGYKLRLQISFHKEPQFWQISSSSSPAGAEEGRPWRPVCLLADRARLLWPALSAHRSGSTGDICRRLNPR
jgi:hypothetical protein